MVNEKLLQALIARFGEEEGKAIYDKIIANKSNT